jgi:TolA-binding protein
MILMVTHSAPLSKYLRTDIAPARLARIWASVSARLELQPRARRPFSLAGAAAALLVVLSLVGIWMFAHSAPTRSAFHAAVLETSTGALTVDLDDRSRLELAPQSRLGIRNDNPEAAAVTIERGRVVCDLARRQGRRFSVLAGDVEVRVTGTRFSVEFEPNSGLVEVAVERGSVLVRIDGGVDRGRELKAGERWSSHRASPQSSNPVQGLASLPPQASAEAASSTPVRRSSESPVPSSALPSAEPTVRPLGSAPATVEQPSPKTLFEQGRAARRTGDLTAAALAYQTLLAKFPNDSRAGLAAFELGRLRMGGLRDLPGAIAALKSAVALLSGSAFREDALAHLVEAYAASGQLGNCRSASEAYLREYPNGVHAALVGRQCGTP